MKYTLTLFALLFFFNSSAQLPSDELIDYLTFENLKPENKADYGSQNNPIHSGAFKYISDRNKMMLKSLKFKNSYRWPNGEQVDFSNRRSINNGVKIVDCYTIVRKGTTDTLKIFVDPYEESSEYFVPKGLTKLTKELLASEIAPYLKLIEELEQSKNPFSEKETAAKILQYISQNIGIGLFNDADMLKKPMTDETADKDVKGFLMRAYIFNKFYALGNSKDNPKQYAYNKLKENFKKMKAENPNMNIGKLDEILK
jgi:hypothetical protein